MTMPAHYKSMAQITPSIVFHLASASAPEQHVRRLQVPMNYLPVLRMQERNFRAYVADDATIVPHGERLRGTLEQRSHVSARE